MKQGGSSVELWSAGGSQLRPDFRGLTLLHQLLLNMLKSMCPAIAVPLSEQLFFTLHLILILPFDILGLIPAPPPKHQVRY